MLPANGQVSAPGGLGNTRADLEAAYGAPTGETPINHLVVFRKDSTEYRAEFVPIGSASRGPCCRRFRRRTTTLQASQAQAEARRLAPLDAQPRGGTAEGNQEFAVERFTSAALGRALPPEVFEQARGQPGDFIVVYVRNAQGAISRLGVAAGDDVDAVRSRISE